MAGEAAPPVEGARFDVAFEGESAVVHGARLRAKEPERIVFAVVYDEQISHFNRAHLVLLLNIGKRK